MRIRAFQDLTRLSYELSATAPDPSASAAFYCAFLAPDQAPAGSSTYRLKRTPVRQ